ncbi:MAG: hypothetical protein ACE5IL_00695 [Myxococcota bacterium]
MQTSWGACCALILSIAGALPARTAAAAEPGATSVRRPLRALLRALDDASPESLPGVSAAPGEARPTALALWRQRDAESFDRSDFLEHPLRYAESFERLTEAPDPDPWTQHGMEGSLRTRPGRRNLFLARARRGRLEVALGDLGATRWLDSVFGARADDDGCWQTPEGARAMLLYCPALDVAMVQVPDGYEVALSAGGDTPETRERVHLSGTVLDNVNLYVREVYPRHPSARATGSVWGNIRAGLSDARRDGVDAVRHLALGTSEVHMHTGVRRPRPSVLAGLPRTLAMAMTGDVFAALSEARQTGEGAVQVAADLVSAVDNALLTPILQLALATDPGARSADTIGDWLGALMQSAVKNLPLGERSNGVIDLRDSWFHDRGWEPARYTRTDTQLFIDRAMTVLEFGAVRTAFALNRQAGGAQGGGGGLPTPLGDFPGDGVFEAPFPAGGCGLYCLE